MGRRVMAWHDVTQRYILVNLLVHTTLKGRGDLISSLDLTRRLDDARSVVRRGKTRAADGFHRRRLPHHDPPPPPPPSSKKKKRERLNSIFICCCQRIARACSACDDERVCCVYIYVHHTRGCKTSRPLVEESVVSAAVDPPPTRLTAASSSHTLNDDVSVNNR